MIEWIEQDASLIRQTLQPIELINQVARVCYNSSFPEDDEESREFIRRLIYNGHESPLEFVDYTWFLTTNRAIANELVRHRIASYMQESTRYVKYDKLKMIKPQILVSTTMEERLEGMFLQYQSMIQSGTRKEEARDFLPLGMATHLYCKMNLREFRHFLHLRLSLAAHPQMRELAQLMFKEVQRNNYYKNVEAFFYDIKLPD